MTETEVRAGKRTLGKSVCIACAAVTVLLLVFICLNVGSRDGAAGKKSETFDLMGKYDMYMTNASSTALDGVLSIKKVYWLSDTDITAPEPDQSKYGSGAASELQSLLDDGTARELLDGQDTLFSTDIETFNNTDVTYYLDDTILAITWKQVFEGAVYTISEVKIADASQLRRFLAGGEFGSDKQYLTTEMAESVNAVVASSGDFYKFRPFGIVTYNGKVCRTEGYTIDTCFIDENGDLLFARQGEITDEASAQDFVDGHNVRFSLCFGPVLVDNGELSLPSYYSLGEVNDQYSRAAIAQMGDRHYLLITANDEGSYVNVPTIATFAARVQSFGVDKAYALDGGQTAAIVMNDQLINHVVYGFQRKISDIIYFATAIPSGD